MRVVLNGEIIYQYGFEEDISEKLSEKKENLIEIPDIFEDAELQIELMPADPDAEVTLSSIEIENRNMVMIGIFGNRIADIVCCLLIVIMAIIMFVLALIRRYTSQPTRGELLLGLLGLVAGLYYFIETNTLSIFYGIQEAYEMQEYLILLISLFLALYFERNLRMVYPHRFFVLVWGVMIHAIVQIFLEILAIRSLEDMVGISFITVVVVCIVAMVSLIQLDNRNKNRQNLLTMLAIFVLLLSGIIHIIENIYFGYSYDNVIGQYSMTIFSVVMAIVHVLQLSKEYQAAAEEGARLLREEVKLVEQQNMQLVQAKKDADAARQEALAANKAKGKFLARMSHEIRTPINAMLGIDEMILRESKEQTIKEYAMDICMAGQTLLSLINDILDFPKIDSGKMEIVPIEYDISSLMHDLVNMTSQRAKNKNYHTKFYAPNAKILVVDDNAVNRKVLRNLLKETQVQITDARGGMECLELVQKNHYDLIFLDHMMPKMDGVEILHHIKKLSDCPCQNTPIVVLTANAVSGAKEKYLSEGFDDFLSKPIVPEKLEAMMKKMLPEELLQEATSEPELVLQQTKVDRLEEFLEELPQVEGLDWHYAWLHLPDMELLKYTVKEFYAQIDFAAENLEQAYQQAIEQKQLESYRIQVHAMKSLAATIGILPLSGLAKILEYAAKDGKMDVILSVTNVFLEEWRSYYEKLQGVFGIEAVVRKEVTDYSIPLALIEMIKISMQEMDIDQADQFIGQLQTYEYSKDIEPNIRKLAEAVTNLDSEEVDYLADLLMEQMEKENGGKEKP